MSNEMIPTDEIIKMAAQAGFCIKGGNIYDQNGNGYPLNSWLTPFAALVSARAAANERESCAKVCEEIAPTFKTPVQAVLEYAAGEIRARGDRHEQ